MSIKNEEFIVTKKEDLRVDDMITEQIYALNAVRHWKVIQTNPLKISDGVVVKDKFKRNEKEFKVLTNYDSIRKKN